jgi:Uma2 family endonuclease
LTWYIQEVLAQQQVAPERIRPLRRVEYEALVEQGLLKDSRVELLLGSLVEMTPQGPLHAETVARLGEVLGKLLADRARIRLHSPLALSDVSEPEPDVAVVPLGDYRNAHPSTAHLVIEVADSSLQKDQDVKSGVYAAAAIPEYWLVDLTHRVFHVHRRPAAGRYEEVHRVDETGVLSPVTFPDIRIQIADFLSHTRER